jgi:hypothetical protein
MHLICSYFFYNIKKYALIQNICIYKYFFLSININATQLDKLNILSTDIIL